MTRELDANLARLRREARSAEKYRALSVQIRALQGALHLARWAEAKAALERVELESGEAGALAERATAQAAAASAAALNAEAAIKPLRDEETTAAAVLHRLAIEKDRLDRAVESAAATYANEATRSGSRSSASGRNANRRSMARDSGNASRATRW